MRTLCGMLACVVVWAAAAAAQPQPNNAPVGAPPLAPAGAAAPAANPFRMIDAAIKDLSVESVDRFAACVQALDYLRHDLATTQSRLKSRNGGQIPSSQAGLIAVKVKRVGRQQQNCIDLTKETNEHFTLVMRSLASVEPNNHPGIPARRQKIVALREKFNAALKKLKVEGKTPPASDAAGGDSSDEGSAQ